MSVVTSCGSGSECKALRLRYGMRQRCCAGMGGVEEHSARAARKRRRRSGLDVERVRLVRRNRQQVARVCAASDMTRRETR